jgi:hypothetical protein
METRFTVKITVFAYLATWKEWLVQGEKGGERDAFALATAILTIAKYSMVYDKSPKVYQAAVYLCIPLCRIAFI